LIGKAARPFLQLQRNTKQYTRFTGGLVRALEKPVFKIYVANAPNVYDRKLAQKIIGAARNTAYDTAIELSVPDCVACTLIKAAMRVIHKSQLLVAQYQGHTTKTWIADPNCCLECSMLNGQTISILDTFKPIKFQPTLEPPLHDHCKCSVRTQ
jgi:hypothetical protein